MRLAANQVSTSLKNQTHRKDAKNAKRLILFVNKFLCELCELCVFAVKTVFMDEHQAGSIPTGPRFTLSMQPLTSGKAASHER
jgi:hypothetical protein